MVGFIFRSIKYPFPTGKSTVEALYYIWKEVILPMSETEYKVIIRNGGIVCPRCGESLTPEDLEAFNACPYCNYIFPKTRELEDFIVSQAVRQWVSHQQFPG